MTQSKAKSKAKRPKKLSKWVFFANEKELSGGECLLGATASYVRKVRLAF